MSELTKVCTRCLKELPLSSFHKLKGGKYGVRSYCKSCINECNQENKEHIAKRKKEYALKHAEETKEYQKRYYQENKEKISQHNKDNKYKYDFSEYNKKYYKSHIDKIKVYAKKHRLETKEQTRIYAKKYHIKNREHINLMHNIYNHKPETKQKKAITEQNRRAMKKELEYNFSRKEWEACKEYFGHTCAYCGKPSKRLEQEHFIALTKGGEYTKNNIIPVCRYCNSSKSNSDFFEWYPRQDFYSREREKKILKYLNYNNKKVQQLALII